MSDGSIAILAPAVYVSITIESGVRADDIHLHAGGQGVWVARMLRALGQQPIVCAPVGGETGRALVGLIGAWGIQLRTVDSTDGTPAYVHDRRGGERIELAHARTPELRRHEVDGFLNRFLELALAAGRCVVTGPSDDGMLPDDTYRVLSADLHAAGVQVVADLHGRALDRFLEGGPIDVLKVSLGDLEEDGRLRDTEADARDGHGPLRTVVHDLRQRGARAVVVSRGERSILAWYPDGAYEISGPALEVVDPRGSGDSMTAALAASMVERHDDRTALTRAWAAGAANVTRRGLGSGIPGLIDQLTARATIRTLDAP